MLLYSRLEWVFSKDRDNVWVPSHNSLNIVGAQEILFEKKVLKYTNLG